MRRLLFLMVGLGISSYAFIAAETENWKLDNAKSTLSWLGRKTGGDHTGDIKLKAGQVSMQNGKLVSGNFTVDMHSITCNDIKDTAMNDKLITHLKSDDFFSVQNYPIAELSITQVSYETSPAFPSDMHMVKGKLTIKGITNNIEFPATITVTENRFTATGSINVDRTLWNIKYKSSKFFSDLGNKVIDDIFVLKFQVEAVKQ